MTEHFIAKADGISIDPPIGETRIIHNSATKKYFRLGIRESTFLESLDGSVSQESLELSNCGGFNAAEVKHLVTWFRQHALLDDGAADWELAQAQNTPSMLKRLLTPELWRLNLADPDKLLDKQISVVHALCSRTALAIYLFLFLLPIGIIIVQPGVLLQASVQPPAHVGTLQWLLGYATILTVIALHELAHAVTCKHFGGKVSNIGVKFLYLQPIVFCDVSGSWRFREVQDKVLVSAAGIILQILLSSIAVSLWFVTKLEVLPYFAAANTVIALMNLYPFAKLDGYWMLVHILNEPNLRQTSYDEVDHAVRKLVGKAVTKRGSRWGMLLFGIGSLLSVPLLWAAGLYWIYRLMGHFSDNLAVAAVVILTIPLLYKFYSAAGKYKKSYI